MSRHHPFQFSAGSGQSRAVQAERNHTHPSNVPPQYAQTPAMDMSVLEGISPEQLAAIARMFQSGALQMPPSVPTTSTQTSAPPQSASAVTDTSSLLTPSNLQSVPSVVRDDMETEEGEVNESEPENVTAEPRDFLRPPPTGPKNRSVSPRDRKQRKPSPRPLLSSAAMSMAGPSNHPTNSQASTIANGMRSVAKNDAAKEFVLEMVKAGYSYNDIAAEVRNEQSLIRMFKELNIPITAQRSSPRLSRTTGTSTVHSQAPAPPTGTVVQEEIRKSSLVKPQAAVKPTPKDRKEYLAQLQAAKTKKPDATSKRAEAAQEQSALSKVSPKLEAAPIAGPSSDIVGQLQPPVVESKAPVAKKPLSSTNRAAMNELLKQKMEALRAKEAAKQTQNAASTSDTVPPVLEATSQEKFTPVQDGLGAGIANISSQLARSEAQQPPLFRTLQPEIPSSVAGESTTSPTPQTPSNLFGSLPGLFMFGNTANGIGTASPSQSVPLAQPSDQLLTGPTAPPLVGEPSSFQTQRITSAHAPVSSLRKRPVASDFDDTPARPGPVKRLFGQSRNASEDESLVIEVSDAEDEDDESESEPIPEPPSSTSLQTKSFRDVAPLRDFPPKQTLHVRTSAPGTPGGITYEQKMKEIEEFKRKIAEKEKKKQKANGKLPIASNGPASATAHDAPTATTSHLPPKPPTESNVPALEPSIHEMSDFVEMEEIANTRSSSASADQPVSPNQSVKRQEKERLRQRLLELQREEDVDEDDEGVDDVESDDYTPIVEPERTVPGATSGAAHTPRPELQEQLIQLGQQGFQPDDGVNGTASEDGELTDDSMSNFYDVQETHVGSQDQQDPLEDDGYLQTPSSIASETAETLASGVQVPSIPSSALEPASESGDQPSNLLDEEVDMELDVDDDLAETTQDSPSLEHTTTAADLAEMKSDTFADTMGKASGTTEDAYISEANPEDSTIEKDSGDEPFISNPELAETGDVNMADDDLAPEIQPAQDDEIVISAVALTQPKHFFTPYRSPLQGFKDYRYHSEYLDTVPGGHRSATYSYNIDPQTSLCPYETAGGKCTDSNCPHQHFENLVLSDTELLKMMGTKHVPANTQDELKRWNEGLGHVVRQLRNTNLSKDANAIAARIAEYRRQFVGDDTKVLNLG